MVGGPTGPFLYNAAFTRRLQALIRGVLEETGGTVYITTSRRTPPAVVEALQSDLPAGARLFIWSADATANPYRALLGLADGFVVTGDSISMMVEVVRLRKPLAILGLPVGALGAFDQLRRSLTRWLFAPRQHGPLARLRQAVGRMLYRSRILTHTRDFVAFHDMLVARGLAVHAGDRLVAPSGEVPDDLAIAVQRIITLMKNA
jgi:hypothetical protein